MTCAGRMTRGAGLAGLFSAIVFALFVSGGGSISAVQKDGAYPKPSDEIKLVGEATCQQCHNEPNPEGVNLLKQTQGFKFVRMWENVIWNAHDMHSQAYKNLSADKNDLAKKMETNLKRLKGDNYKVIEDVNCLACHASVVKPVSVEKPANWTVKSFDKIDGVGCEMCHGHGGAYSDKHSKSIRAEDPADGDPVQIVPWRTWPPAVKSEWGLVNLRDPAVAAAKCSSCHVGNKDEGRFVTHEMYAVGHPPLPPLDLMAYSRELPRHWGLASEMPYLQKLAKADPKKSFDTFHYRDGESLVARRFAESTIGTLKASTSLTHQLAADARAKNDGLDFSAFDCYSCHHDLKYPSDRQARGYDGPPGRPQFRLAPFVMARLIVEHAAGTKEGKDLAPLIAQLDTVQKQLAMAFGNKTYGDPDLVMKAVGDVAKWCDAVQAKLAEVRYTPEETQRLLAKVVEAASREPAADPRGVPASLRAVADPELAQLYLWAAETLTLDLASPPKPPPSLVALRDALKTTVVTRLRPDDVFYDEQKPTGVAGSPPTSVDKRIHERMKVFNSFKADTFRDAFKKLPLEKPK